MGYITKREKVEKLNKINKGNNFKKFFIIAASLLSIWFIVFLSTTLFLAAAGNQTFALFIIAPVGTEGAFYGNIESVTALGWALFAEAILTVIFCIIASVASIRIKTTHSLVAEAIEVVTIR